MRMFAKLRNAAAYKCPALKQTETTSELFLESLRL